MQRSEIKARGRYPNDGVGVGSLDHWPVRVGFCMLPSYVVHFLTLPNRVGVILRDEALRRLRIL